MDIDAIRDWITFRFVRSPGPGGQNVNKLSTTAVLEFDFDSCPRISDAQKSFLRREYAGRLTRDGRLRLSARRHRTQVRNRRDAERRLLEILAQSAARRPTRRPSRPTGASKRRRLSTKKQRGETKRLRMRPPDH